MENCPSQYESYKFRNPTFLKETVKREIIEFILTVIIRKCSKKRN